MVAIFVVATIIVFLGIDYFVQRAEKRKAAQVAPSGAKPQFVIPKGYFFGRGHTWVELLPDNLTRIGLDDFCQKVIGRIDDITFVPRGKEIVRGGELFSVRQGEKSLSFRSPISGKIVSFNDELTHSPDVLRKKPYSDGWVATIESEHLDRETKPLSRGEEAALWLREEIKRFRNFIAAQGNSPALAGATLLDGGVPVEGVMEHTSKEVWRDFEKDFLSNAEKN
jgi:glycine cleavage system H protein